MRLLLDTNFWIYLAKYKLFDKLKEMNVELVLIEPVLRELTTLSVKGNEKINASVALEMIKKWGIREIKTKDRKTDDAILKFASENKDKTKVATMDKALSERLKNEGIKVMIIRQKRDFF